MAEQPVTEQREEAEEHENHELPRGALLITLTYLAILAGLWICLLYTSPSPRDS